ncbi:MAG: tRNA-dihydrouridine synthase family protein, partial [Desulfobulbaceae bacterium]|nr:tRNA-dihydrouridine synthase family protein [Desulfobulbaceae bacterium]
MDKGFWKQLKKPFFALAPMDDVTDFPFRTMLTRHGKPDVMWTEFVSADGLMHPDGLRALLLKLEYDGETERPIVAQLFSASPEKMRQAAYLVADLGFDGVDINMGCPDKAINKQGAGAALIQDPTL